MIHVFSRVHWSSFLQASRANLSAKKAPHNTKAIRYVGCVFAQTRIIPGKR